MQDVQDKTGYSCAGITHEERRCGRWTWVLFAAWWEGGMCCDVVIEGEVR